MENFPSLLDKDDINGPGKGRFPRSNKGYSVDYATFKISLYLTSESPSEKLKFIRELEKLALQLGKNELTILFTLLETIAKDKVQYQIELSKILANVLNAALSNSESSFPQLIPAVFDPLFNSTTDVLVNLFNNFQELLKFIPEDEKQTWLITTLLKIIHDESFSNTEIGVALMSITIPSLTSEVCSSFLYPEILAMSQGETQFKILTLDLLAPILEKTENFDNKNKLIDLFLEFCQSSEPSIKLNCLNKFEKMFAICEDSVSIQKLQPAFKEFLKDKNDKIRHKAHLQLGPLLYASKAPIPHSLLELYLKLAKTVPIDKELQAHCAFYFPAVVEKMGKDSWETLSDTFFYLARSGEVNTKKSCVSSLHHVFRIVGEKSAGELQRIFIEYLYDKVFRAAAMKNVEKILGSMQVESRNIVIEPVKGMVKDKNFRVRGLVAEKLADIANLFMPMICYEHIWPICKTLCLDPIAFVRSSAMQGIGACAVHIISEIPNYSNEIIKDLKKFGRSAKSIHRLVFASACLQLIDLVEFEAAFGDDFLVLCKDKVPAVRILCAKAVKKVKSLRKFWVELRELLKIDEDFDVRREINGDNLCSYFIVAGESQVVVKAPAVRNCLKIEEFEDVWEIQSSDSMFSFMVNDLRPRQEGWIVLNS